MNSNWTKIYTTENAFTAELLKQGLIESDIPAVIMNEQISAYNLGVIYVLVHPDNFDRATAYIAENNI